MSFHECGSWLHDWKVGGVCSIVQCWQAEHRRSWAVVSSDPVPAQDSAPERVPPGWAIEVVKHSRALV
jgi:hypothetical protein